MWNFMIVIFLLHSFQFLFGYEICHNLKPKSVCEIEEITSIAEQQNIFKSLCESKITVNKNKLIPAIKELNVEVGHSLQSHCSGTTRGSVKWVTEPFFENYIKVYMLNKETNNLVSRFNLVTNETNILIEVLPVEYKLQNIQIKPPNNVQYVREVGLGTTQIINADSHSKAINGSIAFGYQKRFDVNFLNQNAENGLLVTTTSNAAVLGDFIYGHQHIVENMEIYHFSLLLLAGDSVNVSLTGIWTILEYEITGTLITIFDKQLNKTNDKIVSAKVTEIKITDIRHTNDDKSGPKDSFFNDTNPTNTITASTVYPEFRPYFHIACIILFGTIFVVFVDVSRKLWNDSQKDLKYSTNITQEECVPIALKN